jgi:hypothetical protein
MTVGKDLNLDVTWPCNVFFDQDTRVAERAFGFPLRTLQRGIEIGMALHTSHAFAAAAREGFDNDGVPDFVGFLFEELRLLQLAVIAGYDGHTRFFHQRFGMMFEAHGTYG